MKETFKAFDYYITSDSFGLMRFLLFDYAPLRKFFSHLCLRRKIPLKLTQVSPSKSRHKDFKGFFNVLSVFTNLTLRWKFFPSCRYLAGKEER
ncbi:CLUMA_CG018568, isoform A [Clunio marinus]|uniref:CLUMA_CG018568, isoform A n=1 Tax=Clunio marinus TaxID=568069 RepID=A0A1J1IYI3_9DIPT|nr:CLUMA_CG018568, isoform A [Clunio marinus]